jgi:hypothetical protein
VLDTKAFARCCAADVPQSKLETNLRKAHGIIIHTVGFLLKEVVAFGAESSQNL